MVICQGMVDEHSACMARGPVGIQDDDGEEQPGYAAAVREWNARAGHVPLIRFDFTNADGNPDSKMITHDEMRDRYAGLFRAVSVERKPVAYAVFTEAGLIRIWSADAEATGLKIMAEEGMPATPLYAAPPAHKTLSELIVALDAPDSAAWLKLARVAGKCGVRYSTNDNMVEFLRMVAEQAE